MAEFNSYLLGKVTKSVGNITLVYTKRKNIAKAKVFKRKDSPTPEIEPRHVFCLFFDGRFFSRNVFRR